MGLFTRDIQNFNDLFVHALRDIYYAEKRIQATLPELHDHASDPELRDIFRMHLRETDGHIARLEKVFQMHGTEPRQLTCPAIDGLLEETADITSEVLDKEVLDAALIFATQAIEHYEITRYGSLVAWARRLGRPDCAALLQQTLDEEKAADKKLTMVAESKINLRAAE